MMKRCCLLLGLLGLTVPLLAQDHARWEGADELPTAPYACDGTPPRREEVAYDGTLPDTEAMDVGEVYDLLHVPSVIGQGYFALVAQGIDEASRELGTIILTTDAPTRVDVLRQARVIGNYIDLIDGLIVAPVNQDLALTLNEFIRRGTWVVSYDLDLSPSARSWHVEATEPNALAYALAESLARQLGDEGRFAILTTGHSRLIAELQAYVESCYPSLVWLETLVLADDTEAAASAATQLMETHGVDLDAILALDAALLVGAGQSVAEAQRCPLGAQASAAPDAQAAVVVTGMATPNAARSLIVSGCVQEALAKNPLDVGYAALEVLIAALEGRLQAGATRVDAGRLGALEVVGSVVMLNRLLVITAENVADFDF